MYDSRAQISDSVLISFPNRAWLPDLVNSHENFCGKFDTTKLF